MQTQIGSNYLHPHQQVAVQWMMDRERDPIVSGGFLCDEMGLGKTYSTLGLLVNRPVEKTLLLCPKAVIGQWAEAAADARIKVFTCVDNKWKCKNPQTQSETSLYITNYDKLTNNKALFFSRALSWNRMVLDEAHNIRNGATKRYSVLKYIEASSKWMLTGTPIVNSPKDLTALMYLFNQGPGRVSNISHKDAKKFMYNYALHRTMDMVRDTIALPSNVESSTHSLDFHTTQEANFYRGVQGRLMTQLQALFDRYDAEARNLFLLLLLRLRQISVHPQVFINSKRKKVPGFNCPDFGQESTKVRTLHNLLQEAYDAHESHGWVVFCNFTDEINILRKRLEKEDYIHEIHEYHGGLSDAQRQEVVAASKKETPAGKQRVFICQIKCGGTGLNLQHMDRVVFMSPWWTSAQMDQAIGRVQRMGQAKQVKVHYLVLREEEDVSMNVDRMMYHKVSEKKTLCEFILQSSRHFVNLHDYSHDIDYVSPMEAPIYPFSQEVDTNALLPDQEENLEEALYEDDANAEQGGYDANAENEPQEPEVWQVIVQADEDPM